MEQTQEEPIPEKPSQDELHPTAEITTTTLKPLTSDKNVEENSSKVDGEEAKSLETLTENAVDKKLFSNMTEDTEIPVAALGVTPVADGDTILSDDENRVLLTLENASNGNTEESLPTERNGSLTDVAIATNQLQKMRETKTGDVDVNQSTIKTNPDATSMITVLSNTIITPATKSSKDSAKPESSLLRGMQNRLTKTMEMKSAATGGIEIPHELISTGLVSPPIILNTQVSKPTLQSQDLIAILEGDDDTEPAEELKSNAHYAGGHEDEDGDELLEQIQISIVGEDGVVKDISLMATAAPENNAVDQRDTREIAMRQIMNLPRKQKRKMKLQEKHDLEDEPAFLNNPETPIESDSSKNDLISSLVSDWSDNEAKGDEPPVKKTTTSKQKPPSKVALALAKTVPIVPPKSIFSESAEKNVKPKAKRPAPQKVVNQPINTSPIKIINKSVVPEVLPPFKRSRVIKKKIIWDPDAPETQISYASLIGSTTVKKITPAKATHTITRLPTTVAKTSTPKTTVAATLAKIPATITVKSAVMANEPATAKPTSVVESPNLEDTIEVIVSESPTLVVPVVSEKKKAVAVPKQARVKKELKEKKEPVKRKRAAIAVTASSHPPSEVSPVAPSPTAVKKKKLTEIDKLLGDEGAINMMYSLEKDNVELENMNTDDDKLGAKTRVIRNVVINKSISPNTTGRSRPKRDVTPVKHLLVEKQQDILLHKQLLQIEKQQAAAATESPGKKTVPARKKTSSKKNDSWDYVYAQRNDDSMIIRRRSNSSYSSTTSPRRLSLDLSNQTSDQGTSANASMDGSIEKTRDGKFEFLKPTNKKMPMKNEDVKVNSSLVSEMKGKLTKVMKRKAAAAAAAVAATEDATNAAVQEESPATVPSARKSRAQSSVTKVGASPPAVATHADKPKIITTTSLKEIMIHHHENVVEISIKTTAKSKHCFTIPMMQEISAILNTLTTSNRCKVVVMWAKLGTFGNGIDYSPLVQPSAEKRKVAAQELYTTLSEFIKTLANFPKLIVYGCEGKMTGLSVSLLPLFDIVFASESAAFTISQNTHILPECTYILSLFGNVSKTCLNNMIYLGKSMDAEEAKQYGIITEVLKSTKFHVELLAEAQKLSSSVQTLGQLKAQQNKALLPRLEQLLDEEQQMLVQHWTSHECQEQLKQLC